MTVVITENKTKGERVKGDDIKMFKGQKFFNITMKGVTFNTFHKRIK